MLWCESEAGAQSVNEHHRHEKLFKDHPLAPSLRATTDVEAALHGSTLVICAVQSPAFRALAKRLAPRISPEHVLLSATKGLDVTSLKRMSELLAEECPGNVVGAIAGPNVTYEIMANQLSAIVVSTTQPAATPSIARLLETERLRVYTNDDLLGVEWFAVLKNVVAIAVAVGIGLDLAVNTRSILMTQAIAEICHLAERKGARPSTFWGLCGIGDLYLTTTSPQSLNREVGIQLGKGRSLADILGSLPEPPEGVNAVRGCDALARSLDLVLPIASTVRQIMDGACPPEQLSKVIGLHAPYAIDSRPA
jgi:glycerol-3-phosphate dehydrogenase (NAD(P)+)